MQSKLFYFSNNSALELKESKIDVDTSILLATLKNKDISSFLPLNNGTLGVNYIATFGDGVQFFFKTHLNLKKAQENLLKEIALLEFLYGSEINCKKIEIQGRGQMWLRMDKLSPLTVDLELHEIIEVIRNYSLKLKDSNLGQYVGSDDTFFSLLERSKLALEYLDASGHLSIEVKKSVENALLYVEERINQLVPGICHGDLGPKNIMLKGSIPIVIDWEDAFLGFEGYDFLYWLTFFKNRKFYSRDMFDLTEFGYELGSAIMVLILVLKSELALSSGEYDVHSMSINDRLLEVINLDDGFRCKE